MAAIEGKEVPKIKSDQYLRKNYITNANECSKRAKEMNKAKISFYLYNILYIILQRYNGRLGVKGSDVYNIYIWLNRSTNRVKGIGFIIDFSVGSSEILVLKVLNHGLVSILLKLGLYFGNYPLSRSNKAWPSKLTMLILDKSIFRCFFLIKWRVDHLKLTMNLMISV